MNLTRTVLPAFVLAAAAGAAAQGPGSAGMLLETIYEPGERSVHPGAPSVTVRVSAFFPPTDYAVGGTNISLRAGERAWVDIRCIPPNSMVLHCLGPGSPILGGDSITGLIGGQLNFPAAGIFANPANPYGLYEARWTTADFSHRRVPVRTATARFDVYPDRLSPSSQSRLSNFVEGAAEILVTPGPLCEADCDTATGLGILDIFDYLCFQNEYAAGTPYACDCDRSTGPGLCDLFDFLCFQNAFAAGCP